MARGHGRILTSIWDDEDFLALPPEQQRLYLFLISQPNLNHAGLLPLTLRRWTAKAAGLTATGLMGDLCFLAAAGFVVMDEDTEEVLIRSFVRNDGVWKQPRVMGAMVSAAQEIASRSLRDALLREVDRIPLDELSEAPGAKNAPSIRAQVEEHIAVLRKALTPSPPRPPAARHTGSYDPSEGGSPTPSATPSGSPSARPDDGHAQGSTHVGAPPRARTLPLPLAPAPIPYPSPGTEAAEIGVPTTAALALVQHPRPDGLAPIDNDGFEVTDGMRRWAVRDGYAALIDIDHATQQFVSHYRSTGASRKSWPDAWQKWIRDDHKRAAERASRPGPQSRQQQETDDMFERAFNRADARDRQQGEVS